MGASTDLVEQLEDWHAEWERAAHGDPPDPGDEASTWEQRGWALARQLQSELPGIDVAVWDDEALQFTPIPDACDGATARLP